MTFEFLDNNERSHFLLVKILKWNNEETRIWSESSNVKKTSQIQIELFSLVKYPSFQVQTCSVFKGTLLTRSEKLTSDVAYLFFLSSKRHIYRHREKTFSATIDKWDLSDLPHNEVTLFLELHYFWFLCNCVITSMI